MSRWSSIEPEQRERGSRARPRATRSPACTVRLSSQAAPRRAAPDSVTLGWYASSSSGANGTGVSGGATRTGGASSSSYASRRDERQHEWPAAPVERDASWSTSRREVLLDRLEDRLPVERPDRPQVEDLDVEPRPTPRSARPTPARVRDDRRVARRPARPGRGRSACDSRASGSSSRQPPVERLVLEEENRVVVIHGRAEKAVGVLDRARADDLEPGLADEPALRARASGRARRARRRRTERG